MQMIGRSIRSSLRFKFKSDLAQQQRLVSHYTVLGVVPSANLEEIKAAFRKVRKIRNSN
jgi:DnaJ-class molecular chaperone